MVVGFNRVYLNAHWLTDIIAAPFLALFIIAASILVIGYLAKLYSHKQKNSAKPNGTASLSVRNPTLYGRAITRTAQTAKQMK